MNLKVIKTEVDYQNALNRLEIIFDARLGTVEGDELDVLSILIDRYEKEHFPIEAPDPIEAIKFRMEQLGMTTNDLSQVMGNKPTLTDVLHRKQKLTLEMIRQLHDTLHIPTNVLVREYAIH
jgi:HTH-type transcriptional regulator / antitoxin HigA